MIKHRRSDAATGNNCVLVVGFLALASNGVVAASTRYQALDLGTLPGGPSSTARSINSSREAVGCSDATDKGCQAVLYRDGEIVDLGTLSGGKWSVAFDINDKHQIVGTSEVEGGVTHAFLFSNGVMQDLGVPAGASSSSAAEINENGQIVGTVDFGTGNGAKPRGAIYSNGHWRVYPWDTETYFYAINDRGLVGGALISEAGYAYGLYKRRGGYDIGLSDFNTALVSGMSINNSGHLVGRGETYLTVYGANGNASRVTASRAVAYNVHSGHITDLGVLPAGHGVIAEAAALDINNHGTVVGYAQSRIPQTDGSSSQLPTKAATFSGGKAYDLNRSLDNRIDLKLRAAYGINQRGDIVGEGETKEGIKHAFMLIPVAK